VGRDVCKGHIVNGYRQVPKKFELYTGATKYILQEERLGTLF